MTGLLHAMRHTLRSLRGTRSLSLAAAACVLLGSGGAVFILTIANGVLRREPPFPDAERLVRIWTVREGTGQSSDVSWLDVQDLAARSRSFDAIEVAARTRAALTTSSGTERLRGESVTPGYFGLIDARPALGRVFTPEEYDADAPRVILLGHTLWMRTFGGDPSVIGRSVRLRGSTGSPDEADALSFGIASLIDMELPKRQALLVSRLASERLDTLEQMLAGAVESLEARAKVHGRAKSNGRGPYAST